MQEAATHEDLRDLHNGEPRRVSRSVAFFHRATDNTRYEEAGPFCGCRTEVLLLYYIAAAVRDYERFLHNFTRPASPQRGRRSTTE